MLDGRLHIANLMWKQSFFVIPLILLVYKF